MSFGSRSAFSKPKTRKQKSDDWGAPGKWIDLDPKPPKTPGLRKVGKKGEFNIFAGEILKLFFVKAGIPDTCEIVSEFCDNYHRAFAHTRRRQDIRTGDWKYVLRVVRACQECHFFADAQRGGRTNSETFLEAVRARRNKLLGLTEAEIEALLLQCARDIQAEDALKGEKARFQNFHVTFE